MNLSELHDYELPIYLTMKKRQLSSVIRMPVKGPLKSTRQWNTKQININ